MVREEDYTKCIEFTQELSNRVVDFITGELSSETVAEFYEEADSNNKIYFFRKHLLTKHGLTASFVIEKVENQVE